MDKHHRSNHHTRQSSFGMQVLGLVVVVGLYWSTGLYTMTKTSFSSIAGSLSKSDVAQQRPQFVFHIQYHKTGHEVTVEYINCVRAATASPKINGSSTTNFDIAEEVLNVLNLYEPRKHNITSGCPLWKPICVDPHCELSMKKKRK